MGERHHALPRLVDGQLVRPGDDDSPSTPIPVGSSSWFGWLADERNVSFSLPTSDGAITVRRERQRRGTYWYAYARRGGKVRKTYVGRAADMTLDQLQRSVARLASAAIDRTPATLPTMRLRLFGAPKFEWNGRPVTLRAAKAVALVGYLAVSDAAPTRQQLQTLLWPDSDAADRNLRNTLWSVRKSLGFVVRDIGDRLTLDDAVWVDVREFKRLAAFFGSAAGAAADASLLQAAADLIEGPFLDGIALASAAELELWLTGVRTRLDEAAARVVDALVASHRAAGRWGDVLEVAGRAIARDPLRETMHRAMMEAYAAIGDRAAALRQFDMLHAVLDRELGVAPLPEAVALRAAILNRGQANDSAWPAALSPPIAAAAEPPPPFVGRETEMVALDHALARAGSGDVRVALLVGELGIGKSRLWQQWWTDRGGGAVALTTRCLKATQSLPFAPSIGLLTQARNARRLVEPGVLPAVWLNELVRLAPELSDRQSQTSGHGIQGLRFPPDEERRRVFEALTQGVLALGPPRGPIVLFVDDIHWADRATLDWLGYLVERARGHSLLVGLALRPEEESEALAALVEGWTRERVASRLRLGPLTRSEAGALIASFAGPVQRTGRAHGYFEQSGGNPLFLTELVRAASDTVPPALAELLRARLDRLPEGARQVLQAAAVLEPDVDPMTLRRTAGRSEDETLDALDVLIHAGILSEADGGGYSFLHPLLATIVRETLGSARRAVLHRRAAAALETSQRTISFAQGGRPSPLSGRLATHYRQAGDAARAAVHADLAAAHALQIAAPAEAEDWARQALTMEPTPRRRLTLAQALFRQGKLSEAGPAYEEALRGFEDQGDFRAAAWASLSIATTHVILGWLAAAEHAKARAVRFLERDSTPETRGLIELLALSARSRAGPPGVLDEPKLLAAARFAASQGLAELAIQGLFTLGIVRAEGGDLAGAISAFRASLAHAQAVGNVIQEALSRNGISYHSLLAGDLVTAHEEIEAALSLAHEQALAYPLQWLYSTRGEVAMADGALDDAADWFERGLIEAERSANRFHVAGLSANLGLVARARGDIDAALRWMVCAERATAGLPTSHEHLKVTLWLAELHADRGDLPAAAAALDRVDTLLVGLSFPDLQDRATKLRHRLIRQPG